MSVLHKFGGSSLANTECFRQVASIILAEDNKRSKVAVVVSAMGGKPKVTDMLLSTVDLALNKGMAHADEVLTAIRKRHFDVIHELLPEACWAALDEDLV